MNMLIINILILPFLWIIFLIEIPIRLYFWMSRSFRNSSIREGSRSLCSALNHLFYYISLDNKTSLGDFVLYHHIQCYRQCILIALKAYHEIRLFRTYLFVNIHDNLSKPLLSFLHRKRLHLFDLLQPKTHGA